ncbi:ABC transporter ATP-binding protein [Pusillimonas sp. DMV24BSW_D]|uniref:ABC transporter ATP-binding protein n=1 Tax=Neopusillimonas aestuarii TaxID=2716226 RepID=UPI00140C7F9B|nr:ABC transporter ATP-binding protein [Pusillimonas sp. DMV24BSW_D]QIM50426.1 ABC transporter ATP-binding protein [Pusillimonas sp. DMV24BSW_D]
MTQCVPSVPALTLDGVGRSFGGLRAVNDVNLKVTAGSTHVVIGPNGAGKTTLFALISGELALSSGTISLFGTDISKWSATRRALAGIGRTYQITNVLGGLTVEQNILLALRGKQKIKYSMFGSAKPTSIESMRLEELLTRCNIHDFRYTKASAMSYGQQRQLELAIALACDPAVLLLDEPAAGLSPAERGPMADIVRQLPDDLTVLLIEHDMELALGLADRVTCLHFGEVLAEGTPDEIRRNEKVQAVYFGASEHHA